MVAGSVLAQETPPGEGQSAGVGESAAGGALGVAVWSVLAAVAVWAFWKRGWFSRASYEGRRDYSSVSVMYWFVGALSLLFVQVIAASVGLTATGYAAGEELTLFQTSMATVCGTAGVLTGLVVFALFGGALWPAIKRSGIRTQKRDLWIGLLVCIAALPLVSVAAIVGQSLFAVFGIVADELAHETLTKLAANDSLPVYWFTAVGVVVGASVGEEIIFRGFFQTGLARIGLGPFGASVIASIGFIAVHPSVLAAPMLPALFVLSVILGLSFEKTGRLGTPIVAHACFNAFNLWASGV